MDSGMRTIYTCRLNNGFGLKFPRGYQDQQTPDDDQRVQLLKHCVQGLCKGLVSPTKSIIYAPHSATSQFS